VIGRVVLVDDVVLVLDEVEVVVVELDELVVLVDVVLVNEVVVGHRVVLVVVCNSGLQTHAAGWQNGGSASQ